MKNAPKTHPAYYILTVTEGGDTECLLTTLYTDPLFIARRCSIALAGKAGVALKHKAFPCAMHVAQSPELLSDCSAAIDFDRGVFSVREGGAWFNIPLTAATTAADWCYERLESIPVEERSSAFYLRAASA